MTSATVYPCTASAAPLPSPPSKTVPGFTKQQIRASLSASSADGAFSSVFENIVKGVLISNFLLELGAGAFEIGLLTSVPMLAHLLQPLGAFFSERTTSRHRYCLLIFSLSRLLWVALIGGIYWYGQGQMAATTLIAWTLFSLMACFILDAMGAASWVSWMAVLVPEKLRGQYFGWRRSLSCLAALLTIPAGGWVVTRWPGGSLTGFGAVLGIGIVMGLVSMLCQFWMTDVNPQAQFASSQPQDEPVGVSEMWKDRNFLTLLLYLGCWTFALYLSAPFMNFYLLDTLQLSVQQVTIYSSIMAGANLLFLLVWGRLADRIGNRPVLMLGGLITAVVAVLWVGTGTSWLALWVVLPLLHVVRGGAIAALELCTANIQLELAPAERSSSYFAAAAAVIGVAGFLGTTVGSLLAESIGGLTTLFCLSALLSLVSLAPLLAVKEARSASLRQLCGQWLGRLPRLGLPTHDYSAQYSRTPASAQFRTVEAVGAIPERAAVGYGSRRL